MGGGCGWGGGGGGWVVGWVGVVLTFMEFSKTVVFHQVLHRCSEQKYSWECTGDKGITPYTPPYASGLDQRHLPIAPLPVTESGVTWYPPGTLCDTDF